MLVLLADPDAVAERLVVTVHHEQPLGDAVDEPVTNALLCAYRVVCILLIYASCDVPPVTSPQPGYFPARFYSGSDGTPGPCANNLAALYPFGPAAGDLDAHSDDGVTKLRVDGTPFAFFRTPGYSVVCVLANGAVTLHGDGTECAVGQFDPALGPGNLGPGVILFWQDIDTTTPLGTRGYPSAVQNSQYSASRRGSWSVCLCGLSHCCGRAPR